MYSAYIIISSFLFNLLYGFFRQVLWEVICLGNNNSFYSCFCLIIWKKILLIPPSIYIRIYTDIY